MGKICNNCGKELSLRAKFCGQCGSDNFADMKKTNNTQKLKPKSNKIYLFVLLGIILFASLFGLYYYTSKFSEKISIDINTTANSDNNQNETNNTSENISDTNATVFSEQSQEDNCDGYTYDEILRAKSDCGIKCSMGCTNDEYKSCMHNNLQEQCNNRKPAQEYNFKTTQNDTQNESEDVGTNRLKDAAYKLITGNKLSNSNDIVEKINSKNIRIYCLSDSNVCKTEEEVAKYLNVPTGGSISKVFGKWTNLKEGDCNDDSDKYIFAIYKHNNLIRYEGYDDDGVITAYKELSNGDIVLEASIESEGYYFNRYIKLSKVGKTLLITWNPEEDKESYTYVYCD